MLELSNLNKVIYPDTGFTKAEVIDYYTRVAEVLLPRLTDRPLTRTRWPDGTGANQFFEKNAPRGTPRWVRTVRLPAPDSTRGTETVDYIVADRTATIVWLANLAALELHVPQWRLDTEGEPLGADLVVIDLDPGAPATLVDCCRVAEWVRDRLAEDGLDSYPKTSGKKGMQLYVPIDETDEQHTTAYAKQLATELSNQHPRQVTATMTKSQRPGKVFLDWSQNAGAKTTIAPYSLRGLTRPTVSTPVTWDEVQTCTSPEDLTFDPSAVLERLERIGDLLRPLSDTRQRLPEVSH